MPVAADDVVWLDVLPSMGRFRSTLQTQAGGAANSAGAAAGAGFTSNFAKHLKVAAVLGGALAVAGAGAFLKESIREASDLNESLNAVNVTFGQNAGGILALGKEAAQSLGLSNSQFNSLAVQFSAFATTIAGKGGDVTGVMKDLTTRGADFASVMNLDVNEAMGLFQSGLAGETEPLRRYGIDLSAAAVENYALSHGIAESAGTMTEAQKVQARYAYLMEQTSKVQGDFGNTSGELANSQRILSARWDDIQAKVGSKVLPILKDLSGWALNTGIPAFMRLGGWLKDTLSPVFGEIADGITAFTSAWKYNDGEVTSSGFPGLMERLGFIAHQVFDYFKNSLIPTFRDIATAVLPIVGAAFKTVGDIVSGTVRFFMDHEGAARALGIAVGIVAGIVVAAWVTQATVSVINSIKSVAAWFATATAATTSATIQSRSTAQIVVGWLAASASAAWNAVKIVAAWTVSVAQTGILMAMYAAQSVASAATSAGAWVAAQARTVGSLILTAAGFVAQGAVMLASMAVTAASVVASWVVMGVQSLIQGARMAAAWILAMGPIAWVIAIIVGLVALIIANWDKIVAWTKAAWNMLVGAIKTAIDWVYNTVLKPILGAISAAWDGLMAAMKWAWDNILKPVWDAISTAAGWLWNNVLKPIFDGIKRGWELMGQGMRVIYDNVIKPIFGFFGDVLSTIKQSFQTAVDFIGRIWDSLKDILMKPVQFVIDFVWNNGLRKLWNFINNLWGGDDLQEFKLSRGGVVPGGGDRRPMSGAFAKGGVMPGYTPGRDVHHFISPTGGRLALSGGEAVMRPEFTRTIGTAGVDMLNALARREGVAGLRKVLGGTAFVAKGAYRGDPPSPQAFAGGGVISLPGWLDTALNFVPGGGFISDVIDDINNGDVGGGLWADAIWGTIKKVGSGIWEAAKDLFGFGDDDAAGGGHAAGLVFARTQVGRPYIWGGVGPNGYDCSGFMSAITNVIRGKSPYSRVGATSSFPWAGFRPGYGPFTIGSSPNTGSGIGHMAGTLLGTNVESTGGVGVKVGGSARGANDGLFSTRAALFDQGGLWEPGVAGFNLTNGIERVLTAPQDDYFRKFVDLTEREQAAPTGPPVHLYTPDIPHALRALRAEEQQREALAPSW